MIIEDIESAVNNVIDKTYSRDLIWFGGLKDNGDDTYIVDLKFDENFIPLLNTTKFNEFRGKVYREVLKLDGNEHITCTVKSCHGCKSVNEGCMYKIQFSEGIRNGKNEDKRR